MTKKRYVPVSEFSTFLECQLIGDELYQHAVQGLERFPHLSPLQSTVWVGWRKRERETPDYEPFVLHAPIQWAVKGDVIKIRWWVQGVGCRV